MSTRLSWSSAATLRSTNSPILPSTSRSSLRDFAAEILIDLDDLQLDLADLAAGLRHRGDRLRALALEPRRLAFERDQPIDLHQVLVPKRPHAFELALDQLDLLRFCLLQRRVPADFLVELGDALLELRLLAEPGAAPQLEQLAFAVDGGGDVGFVCARQQSSREGDFARRRRARSRAGPGGQYISSRPLVTMARLTRVMVSSSRSTTSPAANALRRRAPAARRRCRRSGAAPSLRWNRRPSIPARSPRRTARWSWPSRQPRRSASRR